MPSQPVALRIKTQPFALMEAEQGTIFVCIVILSQIAFSRKHHAHTYPPHQRVLKSPKSHNARLFINKKVLYGNFADHYSQFNFVTGQSAFHTNISHIFKMSRTRRTSHFECVRMLLIGTNTCNGKSQSDTIFRFLYQTRYPYGVAVFFMARGISLSVHIHHDTAATSCCSHMQDVHSPSAFIIMIVDVLCQGRQD